MCVFYTTVQVKTNNQKSKPLCG